MDQPPEDPAPDPKPQIKSPSLFDTILSVLAAFFGVQSDEHRERDFTAGKPMVFIAVAIVLTLVFVFGLILIVQIMLRNAGL